jgi:ligand-binding sensor domain-containing protein
VATNQGLRTFEISSGKISQPALPALDRQFRRLCRDGLGRLWMGGDGLVMIDPDGKTLHAFDALPMLGRSPINALATDPSHPEGVVVAMGTRGLIFIQARPAP